MIFAFNVTYPIPSLSLFLLPVFPLIRLAYPEYGAPPLQAAAEVLLGVITVVAAFAAATPEGSWSSPWTLTGGAATAGLMIAYWARGTPTAPDDCNSTTVRWSRVRGSRSDYTLVALPLRIRNRPAHTLLSMLTISAVGWGSGARGIEKGALSERGAPFPRPGVELLP